MVFPKIRSYKEVFDQPLDKLEVINGTCIYCRRGHMPLVLDAHNLWSCPECLALDLYLKDEPIEKEIKWTDMITN